MTASAARDALAAQFLAAHPIASAAALASLPPAACAATLAGRPAFVTARVLERMVPQRAAQVIAALGDAAAEPLAELSPPRAAIALAWLGNTERDAALASVVPRVARELRDLLSYPDNTAGSLMDPRVYAARSNDTAGDALAGIAGIRKPLYQIYVVDDELVLLGTIAIQDLAVAPADEPISTLVNTAFDSIDAFTHRDEVTALLGSTATPSIAVTDAEGHLLGALRHRTLLGLAEEDAASKMQQMVGASPDERALSPVGFAVRKRLPWLNINLLTAFLAAAVVGLFEGTIAKVTSLAVLLPVVAGQSGNSGSQALAVTMRGLALREIRAVHWPRVAVKELLVGVTNGVAIAVVTAGGVWVWSGSPALAAVIAIAMVTSMAAAGLAGASIPIVLKSLGQDPAQSSSIILTTVTDVVGFSSFLGLATILSDRLV